jgi:hypothetical protein
MQINKNYIFWPLFLALMLVGIFSHIIKERAIRQNLPGSELAVSGQNLGQVNKEIIHLDTPAVVRAIYLTSYSAGSSKKIDSIIELAKHSELNSVVIDIKDFSGYVSYDSSVPAVNDYKTERHDIKDIDGLIRHLHENNIYVIARMAVFQDPALVSALPDRAVQNKYTKKPWADRNGLSWIDPDCRECWSYYSDIAKEAWAKGFDEINLDYVRFPSDGSLDSMVYPFWPNTDNKIISRSQVLNDFFKHMRGELGDAKLSVDLFGFVTTKKEDFGVGQVIEDAFEYFDYISPMVYPSHYPNGYLGYPNPAVQPYEIVNYAMKEGGERLKLFKEKTGIQRPHLRPWLQDFNLGAVYTPEMVQAQIKATQDALGENYSGFMLWNARNVYTESVFQAK